MESLLTENGIIPVFITIMLMVEPWCSLLALEITLTLKHDINEWHGFSVNQD